MIFINTNTNEYPVYLGDLYVMGWSQGQELPEGIHQVMTTDAPDVNENETFEPGEIFYNELSGTYHQTWITREMTEQEKLFNEIRIIRDKAFHGISLTQEEANLLVG